MGQLFSISLRLLGAGAASTLFYDKLSQGLNERWVEVERCTGLEVHSQVFGPFLVENAYLKECLDMIRDKAYRHHENILATLNCQLLKHLRGGGREPFDRAAPALVAESARYAGNLFDRMDGLFDMINIRVTLLDKGYRETVGAVYQYHLR